MNLLKGENSNVNKANSRYLNDNIFPIFDTTGIKSELESDKGEAEDDFEAPEEPQYPSFGLSKEPKFLEFTNCPPQYPKTHPKGYATIIRLNDEILNRQVLLELKKDCQYTQTSKGHGFRVKRPIPFFANPENLDGAMEHSHRCCAGVRVCEYLADDLKIPHTEVDPDGLEWATRLAEQERTEGNSFNSKVDELFAQHFHDTCDRDLGAGKCEGRTVIRSHDRSARYTNTSRLFIGCEKWRKGQSEHTYVRLQHFDLIAVMKLWGPERCDIHDDVVQYLNLEDFFAPDSSESSTRATLGINHLIYP
jgi:hypothetical protein